jgi:hypothetical protein
MIKRAWGSPMPFNPMMPSTKSIADVIVGDQKKTIAVVTETKVNIRPMGPMART